MASRRSTYKDPAAHVLAMDERRNEIIDLAPLQAIALGVEEMDVIMAMAQCDSVERARGDAGRAELLYELEMDRINHELDCRQTESSLENMLTILNEAAEQFKSDPDAYMQTVAAIQNPDFDPFNTGSAV